MKPKNSEEEEEAERSKWNHGDKWLRGRMIGKGGFGSVFLATLKKPKSKYSYFPSIMAVKSADFSDSATLQKEKQVLDKMQLCPQMIRCFGEEITTNANGQMVFNLLLEFARGGTLADQIKKSDGRGLPEYDVKRYTKSILKGLYFIHEKGFVHCDSKPANILLVRNKRNTSADFIAKIGDFGLAKRAILQSKRRRLDPYLGGTASYMAPETVIDHIQEPPSDIWALGCVVLEMLTGKSVWQRTFDLNTEDFRQLPEIPSRISKEGKEFLKGCFVRRPMFRFTAEMLFYQPFLAGVDDDCDENDEKFENDDDSDDEELSSSTFSDNWGSSSGDDLFSASSRTRRDGSSD